MATKGDISDLDVLQFGGKPLVPLSIDGSYSRTRQSGVMRSDSAGGASRQRKKYFGGTHLAEVTFYLETAQQQDYFELFTTRNEGKRFICHLAADRPLVEPYVVQLVSEVNFNDINAQEANVSMTLEIFPARDDVLDDYLYEIYPLMGDNAYPVFHGLREVVEAMPLDD